MSTLKDFAEHYPFDLHSQLKNPKRVNIKGVASSTIQRRKTLKKIDGYWKAKETLIIFHQRRESRLLLHQVATTSDWRSIEDLWEQEIRIKEELSEEQARKVRVFVDFWNHGLLAFRERSRERKFLWGRWTNLWRFVTLSFSSFSFIYFKAFKTYLKPTYCLVFPCNSSLTTAGIDDD